MAWPRAKTKAKGPKVLIVGPTGCYKTRTVLRAGHVGEGAPRLLLIDYEDGSDLYSKEFNFAREKIQQVIRLDDPEYKITAQEVKDLQADRHVYKPLIETGYTHGVDFARVTLLNRVAKNPIDFILVDPITAHYSWVVDKWLDIFLKREVRSPGHRKDYYTLQPRDYDKPKREFQSYVTRLQSVQTGVFVIAHEKPLYAEGEMMKKIGMTVDAHASLPRKVDVHIHIEEEEEGKAKSAEKRHTRYVAVVKKDRTHSLDHRFIWVNGDAGGFSPYFVGKMSELMSWRAGETSFSEEDTILRTSADGPDPEPSTEPEAPAASTPPAVERVTRHQLLRLRWLKDEMKVADDTWRSILSKRNVTTAKDLDFDQAETIVNGLYGRLPEDLILPYRVSFEGANGPGEEKAATAAGFRN